MIMNEKQFLHDLLDYLNAGHSMFHATENTAIMLQKAGFTEIFEKDAWALQKGGKYFVRRNASSIIAFVCPNANIAENGFRIIGSHTDGPGFKVKPGNLVVTADGYVQLNTEPYGGAILSTWFDRPLSFAGKVVLKGKGDFDTEEYLVDVEKPCLVIPNLCIHFNRSVNEGVEINKQKHVLPLFTLANKQKAHSSYLLEAILAELSKQGKNSSATDILDYELYLYETDKGSFVGLHDEFISASKIDNLSLVFASTSALIQAKPTNRVQIMVAFDNEEVGSASANGAASSFMDRILERICANFGCTQEDTYRAYANSFVVSADTGHAVHPNYAEMHDPTNRPVLGGGPILKYNANMRYVTNSVTASVFKNACAKAGVPCQNFVLKSDVSGGSTIGPAISSRTSIPTVDMGTAILAMHSIRETGSTEDTVYTQKAFVAFYEG